MADILYSRRLSRRQLLLAGAVLSVAGPVRVAAAAERLKIGLVLPMSGFQETTGKQIDNALRLYLEQNGDTVEGTRIEVIIRDDESNPDIAKQAARDLVENEKVQVLAGFGTSPAAAVAAPFATQAKIPEVVMGAQTSMITDRSPFIVRSGATLAQSAATLATWAARHGIHKVISLTTDYAPGNDALAEFKRAFTKEGGEVIDELHIPLFNADLDPPLDQIKKAKPDAVFLFVPSQQAKDLFEAIAAHGITHAGIKIIGPGDITDDDFLKAMGDPALGVITAHFYSAAHVSRANQDFVEAYQASYNERPGVMAVAGYDGMRIIREALRATGGRTGGEGLLRAMKQLSFESPRGPLEIDPDTREPVQNIYIRRVEKVDGENRNIEFATFEAVKDPGKNSQ
ncbi:MAG: ABC transporter substrate-binding protein [Xanthobacteraceae bacterium]|nr:ABC transporter substrate-binding protein [Xanthobacteraceae bacterium]